MGTPPPEMDSVEAYRNTLRELVANNKNTINLLTILADDYSAFAAAIVQSIDDHIHTVSREQKLPTMYLTDSIVKNIADPYKKHFEKVIVKMFVHCFKNGDEKVRSSLFKLRDTWRDIYPRGKMYELDLKVHAEDPNWPIDTPVSNGKNLRGTGTAPRPSTSTQEQRVHVNPRFIATTTLPAQPKREGAQPSTSRTVTMGESNEVKVEVKPILKKGAATTSRDPRAAAKDPRAAGAAAAAEKAAAEKKDMEEMAKKVKLEPVDEPMPSDPVPPIPVKKVIKTEPANEVPVRKEASLDKRKRTGDERREKRREEGEGSPPSKHSRRSPPRHANNRPQQQQQQRPGGPGGSGGPSKKGRAPSSAPMPPPLMAPSTPRAPCPPPMTAGGGGGVATPTNVVGSHAFSIAPHRVASPPNNGPKPPPLMSFHGGPPMPVVSSVASSMPPPFVGGPPPGAIPGLMPPFVGGSNPFGPNRGGGGMPPPPMGAAPFMPPPPNASLNRPPPQMMPPPPPARKHVFSDGNRLEGIPANNRIFVDGKAYEVLYIKEAAVIEKDGLPHRIYFHGDPRNVVIDGHAYMLAFGETREVTIDNDTHRIRFGAPSRELYMGDYPFKGAFGGPPIIATINGRRHEIRLSGPAPEVKIEPEPSYELGRFLGQARIESQQAMNPRPAPPPVLMPPPPKVEAKPNLNDLLSKLKTSGIMNILNSVKTEREATPPMPPVASDIRGGSERAPAPSVLFEKDPFDMRHLKVRYDSVVGALLAKRSVCEHCGLRFETLSGPRYEKHLDWHVRKNLAAATTKETKSRAWYCTLKEWVEAKDTAEDEDSGEGVDPAAKATALAEKNARHEEETKKPSVNSDEAVSKTCAVCGEEFEEYFDEDSDKWKLRDCVQTGKQACHVGCASDLTHMEEEIEANLKSEEEVKKEEPSLMPSPTKITLPMDPRLAAKSSPRT